LGVVLEPLKRLLRKAAINRRTLNSDDRTDGLLESPGRAEFPRSQWGAP